MQSLHVTSSLYDCTLPLNTQYCNCVYSLIIRPRAIFVFLSSFRSFFLFSFSFLFFFLFSLLSLFFPSLPSFAPDRINQLLFWATTALTSAAVDTFVESGRRDRFDTLCFRHRLHRNVLVACTSNMTRTTSITVTKSLFHNALVHATESQLELQVHAANKLQVTILFYKCMPLSHKSFLTISYRFSQRMDAGM